MSVVAIPLSLVLCLMAGDGAATRSPIAMLPVAAERVSLEAVPRLEKLDDRLRKAAASLEDLALLDEARTTANLAAVREMGISCEVDDAPCLGKVAVLVDVDRLLVPMVRIEGETTVLRLFVVDREGRRGEAGRTFVGSISADDAQALVREALAAPAVAANGTPTPPPSSAAPTMSTSVAVASASSEAAPPSSTLADDGVDARWLGLVGLVAGGSAVALGAGIGAAIVDAQLEAPEPWSVREGRLQLGQGLVAVAVVGGLVGVAGGVWLAVVE